MNVPSVSALSAGPAVSISKIESDGKFRFRNIPALLGHSGANLLHCRSPFISCAFEHVDNLGAYTASRPETGLLIPSDYVTNLALFRQEPLEHQSPACLLA